MCGRVGNPQLLSKDDATSSHQWGLFASNNLFSRAVTTISYKSVQSIWYCSTNRDGHYHENWQLFGNGGHLRGLNKNERLLTHTCPAAVELSRKIYFHPPKKFPKYFPSPFGPLSTTIFSTPLLNFWAHFPFFLPLKKFLHEKP